MQCWFITLLQLPSRISPSYTSRSSRHRELSCFWQPDEYEPNMHSPFRSGLGSIKKKIFCFLPILEGRLLLFGNLGGLVKLWDLYMCSRGSSTTGQKDAQGLVLTLFSMSLVVTYSISSILLVLLAHWTWNEYFWISVQHHTIAPSITQLHCWCFETHFLFHFFCFCLQMECQGQML